MSGAEKAVREVLWKELESRLGGLDVQKMADAVVALGETRWLCETCNRLWPRSGDPTRAADGVHYDSRTKPCPGSPRRVLVIDDPEEDAYMGGGPPPGFESPHSRPAGTRRRHA